MRISLVLCYLGLLVYCVATAVVAPTLAPYLKEGLALSAGTASFFMGTRSFLSKGMGVFGGILSDRLHPLVVMLFGLVSASGGLYMLSQATGVAGVTMAMLLMGLGGFFMPAFKTQLTSLISSKYLGKAMALLQSIANVGFALGPMLMLASEPRSLFRFGAVGTLMAAGVLLLLFLIPAAGEDENGSPRRGRSFGAMAKLWTHPGVKRLGVFNFFFAIIYTPFEAIFPLEIKRLRGDGGTAMFYLINALVVIFGTVAITSWAEKRWGPWKTLGAGLFFMALAFVAMPAARFYLGIAVISLVFTVGEVLCSSPMDALAAQIMPNMKGTVFGLMAFCQAIGAFVGNLLVGVIYDVALRGELRLSGSALFFIVLSLFALFVGLKYMRGNDVESDRESDRESDYEYDIDD